MENFERQVISEIFLHSHTFDLLLTIYILDQKKKLILTFISMLTFNCSFLNVLPFKFFQISQVC